MTGVMHSMPMVKGSRLGFDIGTWRWHSAESAVAFEVSSQDGCQFHVRWCDLYQKIETGNPVGVGEVAEYLKYLGFGGSYDEGWTKSVDIKPQLPPYRVARNYRVDDARGYVYALSNRFMPGLLKIGHTNSLSRRLAQISDGAGVPAPFEIFCFVEVADRRARERELHGIFAADRVNTAREFFKTPAAHVEREFQRLRDDERKAPVADNTSALRVVK
jgi:hypothetical protein